MKKFAHGGMKLAAVASGVAMLGFAGCASEDMRMMACTAGPCSATVTVAIQGGACVPKTSPQRLDVGVGNTSDIVWTITTPGWKFQNQGIQFKGGSGGGFSSGGGGGGTTFRYHNNHSVKGDHHYKVNVTNGTLSCTEDPTIVNH